MNAIRASIESPPRLHSISTYSDLPLRRVGFLFRQFRNVVGRVLKREQLPAVGQNDGVFNLVTLCHFLPWSRGDSAKAASVGGVHQSVEVVEKLRPLSCR
jgi:hypothetical protein